MSQNKINNYKSAMLVLYFKINYKQIGHIGVFELRVERVKKNDNVIFQTLEAILQPSEGLTKFVDLLS